MSDTYMQHTYDEIGLVARWWGGEYIDLGYIDDKGEFHAQDVINVWDHAKDEPRIPRTLEALAECVDDHIREELEDDEYVGSDYEGITDPNWMND